MPKFSLSNWLLPLSVIVCVLAGGTIVSSSTQGQVSPGRTVAVESLTPLLLRLKKQQDDMVSNQTKIEAQTTALKEELRLAKIYSARGGGSNRR